MTYQYNGLAKAPKVIYSLLQGLLITLLASVPSYTTAAINQQLDTNTQIQTITCHQEYNHSSIVNLSSSGSQDVDVHKYMLGHEKISAGLNPEAGVQLLKEAALNGLSEAQVDLAVMFHDGKHLERDVKQAYYWAQRAALQDNCLGQFWLAHLYNKGEGTDKDVDRAIELYEQAAQQGLYIAALDLGIIYHLSLKQADKAEVWYRQAAQHGEARANNNLGFLLKEKPFSVADDYIPLFELAGEQGHGGAYASLFNFYNEGDGVVKNQATANKWLIKLAQTGDVNGQYHLARRMLQGEGMPKDRPGALVWLAVCQQNGGGLSEVLPELEIEVSELQGPLVIVKARQCVASKYQSCPGI